jgi:maltose/moltooligosaccharide transporter
VIKPRLSFWQIWNMCFGFLGLQFGFALQNANVSRIFQTLGATLDQIPALWTAAPLTGLLVQPLIGYFSDRTWSGLGRRRPFILAGAILAALALFIMPRSSALWLAAGMLWVLDASINISMEPFRALVGDQLGPAQRPKGYAMQSLFIGVGAVVASMMPWILTRFGVSNAVTSSDGTVGISDAVRWSFYSGACVLLAAIGWTVWRTREYTPSQLLHFSDSHPLAASIPAGRGNAKASIAWICAGLAVAVSVQHLHADPQLHIVGAGMLLWGIAGLLHRYGVGPHLLHELMDDLQDMPHAMRRLVPVQFCSWIALFAMWIYSTAAVTQQQFGSSDPLSTAYNDGANWVGVLFGAYNGFAALAAVVIPSMVSRLGLRASHCINLIVGGCALASFLVIRNPNWLLLSMAGVGLAWASILSLPYALLSDSVPPQKMGVYMGIFNIFIVIPQLLAASLLGLILRVVFGGNPVYALVLGGLSLVAGGLFALRVPQPDNT